MQYSPVRQLGRGGMGVVDLAVDGAGQLVVVKRIAMCGTAAEMTVAKRRLRREADILANLCHPHIVPLLDVVDGDDELSLVMPYCSGGDLADWVTRCGPCPAGDVRRIGEELAGALSYAHGRGVLHRDIKPSNVLFDAQGRAYLADFGIAIRDDMTRGLTVSGSVLGTAPYMAPEQAVGGLVTPASDVFSLGATLWFAATGHSPYGEGSAPVILARAARGEMVDRSTLPDRPLDRQLRQLLRRDPARRPSAAKAFNKRQIGPREDHRRRRLGVLTAGVAVALVVLVAASSWFGWQREHAVPPDEAATIALAPAPDTAPSGPAVVVTGPPKTSATTMPPTTTTTPTTTTSAPPKTTTTSPTSTRPTHGPKRRHDGPTTSLANVADGTPAVCAWPVLQFLCRVGSNGEGG